MMMRVIMMKKKSARKPHHTSTPPAIIQIRPKLHRAPRRARRRPHTQRPLTARAPNIARKHGGCAGGWRRRGRRRVAGGGRAAAAAAGAAGVGAGAGVGAAAGGGGGGGVSGGGGGPGGVLVLVGDCCLELEEARGVHFGGEEEEEKVDGERLWGRAGWPEEGCDVAGILRKLAKRLVSGSEVQWTSRRRTFWRG